MSAYLLPAATVIASVLSLICRFLASTVEACVLTALQRVIPSTIAAETCDTHLLFESDDSCSP